MCVCVCVCVSRDGAVQQAAYPCQVEDNHVRFVEEDKEDKVPTADPEKESESSKPKQRCHEDDCTQPTHTHNPIIGHSFLFWPSLPLTVHDRRERSEDGGGDAPYDCVNVFFLAIVCHGKAEEDHYSYYAHNHHRTAVNLQCTQHTRMQTGTKMCRPCPTHPPRQRSFARMALCCRALSTIGGQAM